MKSLTLILFLSIILISCGKYEEGPNFSLASKKARITNKWKVQKLLFNRQSLPMDALFKSLRYNIRNDGSLTLSFNETQGQRFIDGTWSFDANEENLIFVYFFIYNGSRAYQYDTLRIQRLTHQEFWTKTTTGLEIRFIPDKP